MERGACQTTVHRVSRESDTTEQAHMPSCLHAGTRLEIQ